MMSREKLLASELIAEPQASGVVQVRRSVVFLGAAAFSLLILLVFWYVTQRPGPATRVLGQQYQPADVAALDRDYARHSNAMPATVRRPARSGQGEVDPCVLAPTSAECSAVVARRLQGTGTASAPSATAQQAAAAAQQRAEEQARELDQARDSDLKVQLVNGGPNAALSAGGSALAQLATGSGSAITGRAIPTGEYVLQRGMSVPLTLENGVDSTLAGMIVAQVSDDVYDAAHRAVVIPRGSKAIGEYSNATTQTQARLYCTIDTIQLPNYTELRVTNLPCVDLNGQAGVPARVDTHRGRAMSDVALMSVLAAGTQLAQPQASVFEAPSVGSSIAGAVGTQIGNLGTQELSRSLALGPTLHVDEGTKFAAMVKTDITVQPYQDR
jgi:type IV secretion system protein VirB10